MSASSYKQIFSPLIISISVGIGVVIGVLLSSYSALDGSTRAMMSKYKEVIHLINKDYVDTVDTKNLVEFSLDKLLEKLDPHSSYIPAEDQAISQSQLEANFEGVGIEFNIIRDTLYVVTPVAGGPSEKAGIRAGDKIIHVDKKQISGIGIDNNKVFTHLRGPKGTKVTLSVLRSGSKKLIDFVVTRDKIPTYSLETAYMMDDVTGYIKISRFAENTYHEFYKAMMTLKKQGMEQLILDLRDNGGGYLQMAVQMADDLLSEGKTIVYTDGKGSQYDETYKGTKEGCFEQGPVIVLINENSASASEIVAGALQDHDRALIVGRRSFGKGLVQKPFILSDGSELRLTISRYFTPSGRCIQKAYNGDMNAYQNEYIKRMENGELFNADSIKLNDSLKYFTSKKRVVFGGGGIMPDVFIPQDTSYYSEYFGKITNLDVLREFALEYVNKHKNELEHLGLEKFKTSFAITPVMHQELIGLASKAGIAYKHKQFTRSKSHININLKALIARSVWGNDGFYQIINANDPTLIKATTLFPKAAEMLH